MPVEGGFPLGYVVGTGTFTASGQSVVVPLVRAGDFNVSLFGTFGATIVPERSFDGTTWLPLTYIDGSPISWTGPLSTTMSEAEPGVRFRLNCTWSSGTVNYRVSQ